jgi:hypothetical protein
MREGPAGMASSRANHDPGLADIMILVAPNFPDRENGSRER